MHAQSADVVKQHCQESLLTGTALPPCCCSAAGPCCCRARSCLRCGHASSACAGARAPRSRPRRPGGRWRASRCAQRRSVRSVAGVGERWRDRGHAAPARCWTLARWWRATCAGCCWPTLGPRSSRRGAPASLRPCQRRRCCRSRAVARRGRAQVESPRGDALRSLRLTDATGTSLWWRSYVCGVAALAPRGPRPAPSHRGQHGGLLRRAATASASRSTCTPRKAATWRAPGRAEKRSAAGAGELGRVQRAQGSRVRRAGAAAGAEGGRADRELPAGRDGEVGPRARGGSLSLLLQGLAGLKSQLKLGLGAGGRVRPTAHGAAGRTWRRSSCTSASPDTARRGPRRRSPVRPAPPRAPHVQAPPGPLPNPT